MYTDRSCTPRLLRPSFSVVGAAARHECEDRLRRLLLNWIFSHTFTDSIRSRQFTALHRILFSICGHNYVLSCTPTQDIHHRLLIWPQRRMHPQTHEPKRRWWYRRVQEHQMNEARLRRSKRPKENTAACSPSGSCNLMLGEKGLCCSGEAPVQDGQWGGQRVDRHGG
jgi:hypothetical protein